MDKMTNEEAIAIIHKEYLCVDRDCDIERSCGKCDLAMPSKEPILQAYKLAIKALEQEPCTDAISRQAAIDAIWDGVNMDIYTREVKECLEALPSVTPAEKVGQWKRISMDKYSEHAKYWYRCDRCGEDNLGNTNYCPNCGAKMQASPTGAEGSE